MGRTQQSLADEVGVSRIYIQALESNRRMPSMKLLHRLAEALQATVADMVDEYPKKGGRMQLEDLLLSGEVDIWFRRKKLSDGELRSSKFIRPSSFVSLYKKSPIWGVPKGNGLSFLPVFSSVGTLSAIR